MIIKTEKSTSAVGNKATPAATSAKTRAPSAQTAVATSVKLEPHPLSMIFPKIEGNALAELLEDIRQNGVREPITLCQAQILDGRNRYDAATEAGVECPTVEYTGGDPLGFVMSKNLWRRHLTESQRAMVAANVATMRQGERTDLAPSASLPKVSQTDAAKMFNVSERSVRSASTVKEKAAPEVVAAVEAGKVSVSAGAAVAQLPEATQRDAVAKGPKAVKAAAKTARLVKQKATRKQPKQTDQMLNDLNHLAGACRDVPPETFLPSLAESKRQIALGSMRIVNNWIEPILGQQPKAQPDRSRSDGRA